MVKTTPTNFTELRAAMRELEAEFPYGPDQDAYYNDEDVPMLVTAYIAGCNAHLDIETTPESVAQDYAICNNLLAKRLAQDGELVYDGVCGVICDSLAKYLFQIYTSALDGIDDDAETQLEWTKVRTAFIVNGYATADEIPEMNDA